MKNTIPCICCGAPAEDPEIPYCPQCIQRERAQMQIIGRMLQEMADAHSLARALRDLDDGQKFVSERYHGGRV